MRALTKLEKTGLAAAVVVAGSYFYMTRVVAPAERGLARQRAELAKQRETWNGLSEPQEATRFERPIARLRAELEPARAALAEPAKRLLDAPAAAAALAEVVVDAVAGGLVLLAQSDRPPAPPPATAPPPPDAIDERAWRRYHLVLRGPYSGVVRWLERIVRRPHALLIDDLQIERGEAGLTTTVLLRM